MMDWVESLKEIINLSKGLEKRLRAVEKLSGLVRFFDDYIECDPYNEDCYHVGYGDWVKGLKDWVDFYHSVRKAKPEEIPDKTPWEFRIHVDYKDAEITNICRKENYGDCIDVYAKLPLDEEAKKKILAEAKKKIEKTIDYLPVELARLTLTVLTEILPTIKDRLERLEQDYHKLREKLEKVIE